MATQQFRMVRRPAGVLSRYEVVVVDDQGIPHYALSTFYLEIQRYFADGTARTYLHTLLPYFTYLVTDEWRLHRQDRWDSEPAAVRQSVRDYLVERLHCKALPQDSYQLISLTHKSPSTVRVFLSALKQFYHVACRLEWYAYPHPLTDPIPSLTREIEVEQRRLAGLCPRMPQWSGVEEPLPYSASDNYFKLVGTEWKLHPIDDPDLHVHLCKGFKLAHFSLRDQLVVRIAYESGARIHEILCLTVGDWRKRGAKQEALACNKGSHERRVKTLRFSSTTARMLHAYVNTERIQFDPLSRRLEALDDPEALFLSRRGKPYSYDGFKKHWYRLCQALTIDLNIHALRHWFVTQELRLICETAKEPGEIERGKEGLVRYMAWRNPDTLRVYEHYFDEQQHASIQDQLHAKWHEADVRYETASLQGSPELFPSPSPSPQQPLLVEEQVALTTSLEFGWDELLSLGGATHG